MNGRITLRAVLVGTVAMCLFSAIMPYNDEVLLNTRLAVGYLPVALVLTLFVLVVLVNAMLHRWRPAWALQAGELATIVAMVLVGSAPALMMRTVLPVMVAPFWHGETDSALWTAFVNLRLPAWLFPVDQIAAGRNSPVVRWYFLRAPPGEAVPYAAWIVPMLGWSLFFAAMAAAFFGMAAILRHQWAVNERLPFPLARVELELIQPPRPGRALNDLLGSGLFWIALTGILLLHGINGLHNCFPRQVPQVPLTYDLETLFGEPPWSYLGYGVKRATLYFTLIGICYFIQARTSFSLWAVFLAIQLLRMNLSTVQYDVPTAAWNDQHLGSGVAMFAGIVFVGRHHLWTVLRRCLPGRGDDRHNAPDGSYRVAAGVVLAGLAGMFLWLALLGVQWWVAAMLIATVLVGHTVVARIVAETGIPLVRSHATMQQVTTALPPALLTGRDMFFTGAITMSAIPSSGHSPLTMALHGMQVADGAGVPRAGRRLLWAAMAWALVLGYAVTAGAFLRTEYRYSEPMGDANPGIVNKWGGEQRFAADLSTPLVQQTRGRFADKTHNPWLHMGGGFAVTGLMYLGSLRWTNWPLMPVGYFMAPTWQASVAWFSIFLGWLIKVLIVKYGGARLYQNVRPLFVGMIFGEALAAGLWAMVTLGLAWGGWGFRVYDLLPH